MTAAINHEVKTVVQKRIHKEVLTDVTQRTYQHRMAITGLGCSTRKRSNEVSR